MSEIPIEKWDSGILQFLSQFINLSYIQLNLISNSDTSIVLN